MADSPNRVCEVRRWMRVAFVAAALAAPLCAADAGQDKEPHDRQQSAPPATPETEKTLKRLVGARENLDDLTLIKSSGGRAVVRFRAGPLELIAVGDRLGRHKAVVTEIDAGRIVLEEMFTGPDGRPNRAQILLKDGEKGGTRYLNRPLESRPPAVRPRVLDPKAKAGAR